MIDVSLVLSRYKYNPDSGEFTRTTTAGGYHIGTIAGKTDSYGYTQITIQNKAYLAHRLAWLIIHEEWPTGEIDHINGNRSDNRISNLRVVSRTGNNQNRRVPTVGSKTGTLGVSPVTGASKFQARISVNRKQIYIGSFDTPELAHAAYLEAKRKFHPTNSL